jgi:hypothetical protein
LVDASIAMESFLESIAPSKDITQTPPIVPWFSPADLIVEAIDEGLAGDNDNIRPFSSTANTLEAFGTLASEIGRVNDIIDQDSSQLLRKSLTMYAKYNTNSSISPDSADDSKALPVVPPDIGKKSKSKK